MLFAAILCANCSNDEPPPIDPPPGGPAPSRVRVQIVIYDGFEISDALMPFDVLKIAGHLGADIETNLVTTNNAAEVTSRACARERCSSRAKGYSRGVIRSRIAAPFQR